MGARDIGTKGHGDTYEGMGHCAEYNRFRRLVQMPSINWEGVQKCESSGNFRLDGDWTAIERTDLFHC